MPLDVHDNNIAKRLMSLSSLIYSPVTFIGTGDRRRPDEPPGNIAVSATGRIFITIHPLSRPAINKVVELIKGKPVPYHDADSQQTVLQAVLGMAIDHQNRLWLLDDGLQGIKQPRLLAFGLKTNQQVKHFDFPSEIAGFSSFLNDLQIDPAGLKIYIADTSTLSKKPTTENSVPISCHLPHLSRNSEIGFIFLKKWC